MVVLKNRGMNEDLLVQHAVSAIQNGLSKKDLASLLRGYGYTDKEIAKAYKLALVEYKKASAQKRSFVIAAVMVIMLIGGTMLFTSEATITNKAIEEIPDNTSYSSTSEYDGTAALEIISTSPIALTS
jgi:hypothetical protein